MGARWDRPVETRRLAVNVDVDSLSLYHDIHGLDPDGASDACWEVGVPRFLELFEAHDLRATFFCVASDLSRPGPRRVAQEAVARGHELASHTLTHPYDLIHQDDAAIEAEIAGAETALAELRGAPVAGFRAPGYNLSPTVLKVLERRGYRYDSSRFPCPAYFLLRAGIISGMRVVGRTSKSIVGDLKAPFGPRHPHRMVSGMVEFPMTVLPGVRFPLIGTSLALMGAAGVRAVAPALGRMRFVNLEFHAIDLLEADDLPGSPLLPHQPDLSRSLSRKRAAFSAAFTACAGAGNDTLEGLVASY